MTGLPLPLRQAGIRAVIPHRYPVLLVDQVSEVEPGRSIVTVKAVSGREPCYADSAEEAYPVGLLLESWAQSAVLLTRWENPNPDVSADKVELITGIRDVVLHGEVFPGDVVEHHVQLVREVADAAILAGHSLVAGRKLLEIGSFTMARRGVEVLRPEGVA
ncbi:3-hydroxyacyl-[acyl-carrier-protein] dehydratase [Saccharothrix tamanrassetensis]|uniref:3-hydroxyacyl-[acyl-carrier-protein] dehydratase n=1 Tax=Saccharothrix tamanrassetensis TaxID=1051531 RepID=A0A841CD05_9PSEU|nr:3-hydroxyacyl-ACP dehydratase [Saccharothrix tamanrassetensis]MBB5954057.1 3-hydroxyacyl-[acyl-carrier-protein] dehydratase [Saccharothrix tamanrassetensis]